MSRRKKEKPDGMKCEKTEVVLDGETVTAYYYNGRKTMTASFRMFVGKLPKVGGWARIRGGWVWVWTEDDPTSAPSARIFLPQTASARIFLPQTGYQPDPALDGDWLIEGVEILNDHVEVKLIQYD